MGLCFAALDFETANYYRHSACSIGLVIVKDNRIITAETRLIDPETYFLKYFTNEIHGITAEDVTDAGSFKQVWTEISSLLKDTDFIAAHNAVFDKSVLYSCCEKHNLTRPCQKFLCTVKLARDVWNIHPTRLSDVCDYLDIELDHHNALSDAMACAHIVQMALAKGFKIRL